MYERYTRESLEQDGRPLATINAILEAQAVADEMNYEPDEPTIDDLIEIERILIEALVKIAERRFDSTVGAHWYAEQALRKAGIW